MTLLYAYNFDEASGNIIDQSGNGRDITLGGALARTASGAGHTAKGMSQSSNAFDSNGPALAGLQTAQFTVMCWVKRTDNTVNGWLCELKDAGSGDRGILFLTSAVQARARNSSGTVVNVSTSQPATGTWYHVAASYSTVDSKVHLYINGSEIGTGAALTGPLKTTSTSSSLFDEPGPETVIDDVRYYDTALDAATITTLMGTPVAPAGTALNLANASETSTARALVSSKAQTYTAATETDAARPAALLKAQAYAVAGEAGTAWPMTFTKGVQLARATEADAAQPMSFAGGGGTTLTLARATETDTAQPMALAKAAGLLTAPESDAARPVSLAKAPALSRATETGTALPAGLSKTLALARALETDIARPMAFSKGAVLGRATELDAAHAVNIGAVPPFAPATTFTLAVRPTPSSVAGRARPHTAVTRQTPYTAATRTQET